MFGFVVQDVAPYLTWDKVGELEVGAVGKGSEDPYFELDFCG